MRHSVISTADGVADGITNGPHPEVLAATRRASKDGCALSLSLPVSAVAPQALAPRIPSVQGDPRASAETPPGRALEPAHHAERSGLRFEAPRCQHRPLKALRLANEAKDATEAEAVRWRRPPPSSPQVRKAKAAKAALTVDELNASSDE